MYEMLLISLKLGKNLILCKFPVEIAIQWAVINKYVAKFIIYNFYFPITSGFPILSTFADKTLWIIFEFSAFICPMLINIWTKFNALVLKPPTNDDHSRKTADGSFDFFKQNKKLNYLFFFGGVFINKGVPILHYILVVCNLQTSRLSSPLVVYCSKGRALSLDQS